MVVYISGETQEMGMSMVIHFNWVQRLMTEDEPGETGRAVGGIFPGEEVPTCSLVLVPCRSSALSAGFFLIPGSFIVAVYHPVTVGTETFLDLINTLKIQ